MLHNSDETDTSNHKQFASDATGSPTHDVLSYERKAKKLTESVAMENAGCAAFVKLL